MQVSTDTGFSGLWNGHYGQPHQLLPDTIKLGNSLKALAELYSRRVYDRGAVGAILNQLASGNVGGTATLQHKRVKATRVLDGPSQGGAVEIETFNDVNRASTVDDAADFAAALTLKMQPVPYREDASGNGGGSKLGY